MHFTEYPRNFTEPLLLYVDAVGEPNITQWSEDLSFDDHACLSAAQVAAVLRGCPEFRRQVFAAMHRLRAATP